MAVLLTFSQRPVFGCQKNDSFFKEISKKGLTVWFGGPINRSTPHDGAATEPETEGVARH